jgi:hypothetical protein
MRPLGTTGASSGILADAIGDGVTVGVGDNDGILELIGDGVGEPTDVGTVDAPATFSCVLPQAAIPNTAPIAK